MEFRANCAAYVRKWTQSCRFLWSIIDLFLPNNFSSKIFSRRAWAKKVDLIYQIIDLARVKWKLRAGGHEAASAAAVAEIGKEVERTCTGKAFKIVEKFLVSLFSQMLKLFAQSKWGLKGCFAQPSICWSFLSKSVIKVCLSDWSIKGFKVYLHEFPIEKCEAWFQNIWISKVRKNVTPQKFLPLGPLKNLNLQILWVKICSKIR